MRFRHLTEQIYFRPWYITGAGHLTIQHVFAQASGRSLSPLAGNFRSEPGPESGREIQDRFDDKGIRIADLVNARQPMQIDSDGIATIDVYGPLGRGLTAVERACGATSFEEVHEDLAVAKQRGARGYLLRIDSPGGTVNGTPELAAHIAQKALPTVVHCSGLIASGGYYVAAGADAIVLSPSAQAGSIGVLFPWVDFREQMKMLGLLPDPITNDEGDLKGIGFAGSLTPAQRDHLKATANQLFADFRDHVTSFREIPAEAMRGQTLFGREALAANLVDEIGDLPAARAKLKSLMI